MQWEGLYEAVFNTFVLTQAGRRRATHFVKLVSSQVEKIEKWSGLAIKQLTSYCVPSPEQVGNETSAGVTPVPRPGANGSPRCVIVCRGTGACMDYHRQHAAGWFKVTMRRHSVQTTGSPWNGKHWRHSHLQFRIFVTCSKRPWQFLNRAGHIFSQCKEQSNNISTRILLCQSTFKAVHSFTCKYIQGAYEVGRFP